MKTQHRGAEPSCFLEPAVRRTRRQTGTASHAGEQALQATPAIVPFQAESPVMAQDCATGSDSLDFGTEIPVVHESCHS